MTPEPGLISYTRKHRSIIAAGIALAFLAQIVLILGIRYLPIDLYDKLFYSRFIFWGVVALLFFYANKIEKQPLLIWEKGSSDVGFFIIAVFVLYLVSVACGILSALPRLFGMHENDKVIKMVQKVLTGHDALIFFMSLTAGVTEEVIFRGYILTRLTKLLKGKYLPVIISAVLFSALHYGYNSLQELIFAFLIGVVFGAFYQKYRNIKILIVVHFLIDMISLELATHLLKK